MKKVLIIGCGSIGTRHGEILKAMGNDVAYVTSRSDTNNKIFKSLDLGLKNHNPEYIIISNRTSEHFLTFQELIKHNFRNTILIEKPIFSKYEQQITKSFKNVYVAYNFRFHPLIKKAKEFLKNKKIVSAFAYVGQYLPQWRPTTDYRQSYSAKTSLGGGVLRDLSHELDFLLWLLGPTTSLKSSGGHYSNLEIETEDAVSILMSTKHCPHVLVHMNYLDRRVQRTLKINTTTETLEIDLVNGTFSCAESVENVQHEQIKVERNFTYQKMHEAILSGASSDCCTFEEGLETLKLIEKIELNFT